jgi:hypothetical protein
MVDWKKNGNRICTMWWGVRYSSGAGGINDNAGEKKKRGGSE